MKGIVYIGLLALLFVFATPVYADHLVLSRAGIVRKTADKNSAVIKNVKKGDTLLLIGENQVNGYYHVQIPSSGKKGWIYRTFVRRYQGNLQQEETDEQGTGPVTGAATDSVIVRVFDVGQGHCAAIRLPGNKYVLYDAGGDKLDKGPETFAQVKKFIPVDSAIELMVISHMDADHIAAAGHIISAYKIKKLVYNGYDKVEDGAAKETKAYERMKKAIRNANIPDTLNLNQIDSTIMPGNSVKIGGAVFKLLCGFPKPRKEWKLSNPSERLNAVSIVMKMEYMGSSVLFTGDALGRKKGMKDDTVIATEKFLLDKAGNELKSTVLIVAHHGAENGSALPFLKKVSPDWIVIPAGHDSGYAHPREETARRLLMVQPDTQRIFRTDRGDNEIDKADKEWKYLRIKYCIDEREDDDIQITLMNNGKCHVRYLDPRNLCKTFTPH